ncbi:MAG: PAS domain-containing protein, partial [Saprospiraceae bacterium]|nr:PAS domain-containing protein [Pyrinomonadaceae bacterium]
VSHDNITLEKLANTSLMRDKERLQRLLDTTNIIPWEACAKSRILTHVGEQAEQMLGYPAQVWLEPDFWISHIHPDDRETTLARSAEFLKSANQFQYEYRMIAANGRIVWINDIVSVEREGGKASRIHGFMIDVTERKQSENTLTLLSGRLITAQEEERKRIARELHDDLNQRMALLSIELEQVGQMLPDNADGLAERVKGVQKKAIGISTEIHRMSYKLHPSKLDHLGLAPALKSFCAELAESRGLTIDFRHEGFPAALPRNTTLCLFRIAQEALQNAAKHSGASKITVHLTKSDENVALVVSDAGQGFDVDSNKMTTGLGFISMKERLRLVAGTIDIKSKQWTGTQISVSVPLKNVLSLRPALSQDS